VLPRIRLQDDESNFRRGWAFWRSRPAHVAAASVRNLSDIDLPGNRSILLADQERDLVNALTGEQRVQQQRR